MAMRLYLVTRGFFKYGVVFLCKTDVCFCTLAGTDYYPLVCRLLRAVIGIYIFRIRTNRKIVLLLVSLIVVVAEAGLVAELFVGVGVDADVDIIMMDFQQHSCQLIIFMSCAQFRLYPESQLTLRINTCINMYCSVGCVVPVPVPVPVPVQHAVIA